MPECAHLGLLISSAILLRWSTTYHPYSGAGKPPMYGDYEAQRHWQEITLNVPLGQWYRNTTDNDLQYWGLDYPPLTAYHSLLLGAIANSLDPSFVELEKSRGFESDDHKHFMRLTVLAADALIYIPAVILYFWTSEIPDSKVPPKAERNIFGFRRQHLLILSSLLYPGIILIDHGHFQYNCVSLGLFVLAVVGIMRDSTALASLFFVLALNYKQMELYHALPFFFYILGVCLRLGEKSLLSALKLLVKTALVVLATFFVIWAPFLDRWPAALDALVRLFPLGRGLFEDKVANFWCSANVAVKLKTLGNDRLFKMSLTATSTAVLPTNLQLLLRPSKERFLLSLVNTSLGFFLFSFQVHEKSILLVAVPVMLYFREDPLFCFWLLGVSCFSMIPLLIRDGLFIAYCGAMGVYCLGVVVMVPEVMETSGYFRGRAGRLVKAAAVCSAAGAVALSLACYFVEPPERYPDLFPLLVSVYCFAHFFLFLVYFNLKQFFGGEGGWSERVVRGL
ncbi:probable dolichyl pyrophosphate Man9GlcNAc2 alpha-1,3-glucosyltransferase [Diachasma alloeum]|uniref:probable dolichyl pyrophosphate Man9GlcNAc2 alpha-1,3-glucosyltransferase n=1 Tax=Diachasma alloeum TaxID=454923 RepID=UPI00073820FA|nr:probable dolichyl pyrophosphate Man9GlcNAc2 alpha-1,3-glucosyltransferase [Diachasma alloeum]